MWLGLPRGMAASESQISYIITQGPKNKCSGKQGRMS